MGELRSPQGGARDGPGRSFLAWVSWGFSTKKLLGRFSGKQISQSPEGPALPNLPTVNPNYARPPCSWEPKIGGGGRPKKGGGGGAQHSFRLPPAIFMEKAFAKRNPISENKFRANPQRKLAGHPGGEPRWGGPEKKPMFLLSDGPSGSTKTHQTTFFRTGGTEAKKRGGWSLNPGTPTPWETQRHGGRKSRGKTGLPGEGFRRLPGQRGHGKGWCCWRGGEISRGALGDPPG